MRSDVANIAFEIFVKKAVLIILFHIVLRVDKFLTTR